MIEIDSLIIDLSKQDKTSPASIKNVIDLAMSSKNLNELSGVGYTTPEMFGAVGDGVTDDTQAWIDAIAAGSSRIVCKKTATYLLSNRVLLPSKITIDGNFCTIKRANGRSSLLTATAAVGGNTATVADGSVFRVGDTVGISNTTGANGGKRWNQISNWPSGRATITNIVGNVLTFSINISSTADGVVTAAFPVGSTVFTAHELFVNSASSNDNTVLNNIIFDGNKANNDFNYFWGLTTSLNMIAYNTTINKCTFINSPNETIFAGGPCIIYDSIYEDINGSFVHIGVNGETGHEDVRVFSCRGLNSNIKDSATETGHSEGIVTLSAGPYNVWVQDNHFRTSVTGRLISQPIPNTDPLNTRDKIWILNNKCETMIGITDVTLSLGANAHDLRIEDNEFIKCGPIYIQNAESPNTFRKGTDAQLVANISRNTFENTQMYLSNVAGLTVSENKMSYTSDFVPSTNSVFARSAILVKGYNVTVSGNIINLPVSSIADLLRGITTMPVTYDIVGGTGGFIKNAGGVDQPYYYGQNVVVVNNIIANAKYGIIGISSLNPSDASTSGAQRMGWLIAGNVVQMAPDAGATGIMVGAGCVCENNTVIGYGGTTSRGIQAFGASSVNFGSINGAVVKGNTVMGTLTDSIIYGMNANNAYNNIIINNIVTKAVTNAGVGSGNVESGQTILPIASQAIPRQALFQFPERY